MQIRNWIQNLEKKTFFKTSQKLGIPGGVHIGRQGHSDVVTEHIHLIEAGRRAPEVSKEKLFFGDLMRFLVCLGGFFEIWWGFWCV